MFCLVQSWFDDEKADQAKLPGEFEKTLNAFDRLILLRAMRPDRVSTALAKWIGEVSQRETTTLYVLLASVHTGTGGQSMEHGTWARYGMVWYGMVWYQ